MRWQKRCAQLAVIVIWCVMFARGTAQAVDEPVLVVGSYGGVYEDVQRQVFFEPFTKQTGIKIVTVPVPPLAKLNAMVDTGTVDVDLVEFDGKDLLILSRRKLLEELDYSLIPPDTIAGLAKNAVHPNGIGMFAWGVGVTYHTKKYSEANHPRTWAELWDVKKYPGARTLPAASWLIGPIEMALLADGVPPDKLYPVDLDRAFRSLDKIRPNVVKWWKGSAEAAQLLSDGHADLGGLPLGRTLAMKARGAPVDVQFNQTLAKLDYWMVPKGAKHRQNAMKFIAYYVEPKRLGEYATVYPVGASPINKKSLPFVDPKVMPMLLTAGQNAGGLVYINEEWWAQESPDGKTNFEKVLDRWNEWIGAR
jgi:putative spermidine/putrescine transport system substrate-binding protein